ncbi:MAG TPA: hypothetical protein DCK79_05145 [Candidatus Atribacteria bacterium]|nr:hypothetical protein [Candidatus Atribacteria bacterium]
MADNYELIQHAKAIPKQKRKEILMSFKEIKFHSFLKELLQIMEPNYTIEITHGVRELGKDLVIVKKDKIGIDVIGLIVKIGNIKAKTLGDVDEIKHHVKAMFSRKKELKIKEIESQIEQALTHPAEIKTIFEKLPVSKVIVILVGTFSRQAVERLTKEIEGNVEIRDIDWLTDKFSEYYPQVFFEGKAIDFLQNKIQEMENKHWLSKKKKINLSEYFVEPMIEKIGTNIKINNDDISKKILESISKKQKVSFSKLKSLLNIKKPILLVGEEGVGKSEALTKLAIDLMKKEINQSMKGKVKKINIPVLISAKDIVEAEDIDSFINEYFCIDDNIKERFKIETLMIDALDEITAIKSIEVIEKAKVYSEKMSCPLIITSRKIDIIKNTPEGFEKYEILPFEYSQALQLFEKLVQDENKLKCLKNCLEKITFQIPKVPLSLILLIELVEENKEIPASITELYERFSDLMLGRWDSEKGIKIIFEYIIKRNFLSELAFKEFFKKDRVEINKEEYIEFSKNYCELYFGATDYNLNEFLKEIERAGIININGKIKYNHRSFLDYFVARYIYDKRDEISNLNNMIVEIYFSELWGDVTFYYIGLKREISKDILEAILHFEERDLSSLIDKFLLGKLLQAGWHSKTAIKYRGIEESIKFAPKIREGILKVINKEPLIYSDLFIMLLSDLSLGSRLIYNEAKSIFYSLSKKLNEESYFQMLLILWATQELMTDIEFNENINIFLESFPKIYDLKIETQARLLLLLSIIKRKDNIINKKIKNRLMKLVKKYPETFRKLLPHKKKGFRK